MKIHHLRNATFVIESGRNHILIDPMLSENGKLPPFAYLKHKARRNPLVSLPENAGRILEKTTLCLITHSQKWGLEPLTHTDHFDSDGRSFLRDNNVPVVCLQRDVDYMQKHGIRIKAGLNYWERTNLPGGTITAVPARP